jgi:putative transposase
VVQQAYVCGVSTRRVDQLVESLGLRLGRSEVSRVCEALDEHVEAFRTRPLEGRYPYLFLDAKVEKVRDGGCLVNKAPVIAHGVHETGRREILGLDVGEAETETFWTDFLRGLVKRGLSGVQLAISDAHAALKAAIAKVLG